jgi:nucleoid DNA-binding protein
MLKTKIIAALKKAAPDIQEEAAHHIADAVIEVIIQALADAAIRAYGDKDDELQHLES